MREGDGGGRVRIVELREIDSTSSEAMRRVTAGERGPVWIRADRQTAGRGRSGRPWQTSDGNLAASLLFEPGCSIARVHELALVAGVAAHDAISLFADPAAHAALALKWPNDLLLAGAKIGGILTESTNLDGRIVAVIGVGINIAVAPALDRRATASLAGHPFHVPEPAVMLTALAGQFEHWRGIWSRGDRFADIRRAWLARALPLGHPMAINTGADRVEGDFAGLDEGGALLLACRDGGQRRFAYGDVTVGAAREQLR